MALLTHSNTNGVTVRINLFTLNSKGLILLARYQPFVVAFVWVIRAIAISRDSLFRSQHNYHIPYTLLYIGPCQPAAMAGTATVITLFSHIIDGKLSDVAKKEYICIR